MDYCLKGLIILVIVVVVVVVMAELLVDINHVGTDVSSNANDVILFLVIILCPPFKQRLNHHPFNIAKPVHNPC